MPQSISGVLSRVSWLLCVVAYSSVHTYASKPAAPQTNSADSGAIRHALRMPRTPPIYAVTRTTSAPKIDGRLDDDCWKTAGSLGQFYLDTGDGSMSMPTVTEMVFDDTYLYFAVDCSLPGASDLKLTKGKRDNITWGGETIELFLDTDRNSPEYVQIIFDMTGAFTDMLDGLDSWNGDITAATHATKDGWQLEARLKIADLAGTGKLDPFVWGCNVCRSTSDQSGSWADLRDTFQQPDAFGWLTFSQGPVLVDDVGTGIFSLPADGAAETPVWLALRNPTSQPASCNVSFTGQSGKAGTATFARQVSIPAGSTVNVAASLPDPNAPSVLARVTASKDAAQPLFEVSLPVVHGPAGDDCLSDNDMTCAIRPVTTVATTTDQAAVYLLAQSFATKQQELAGKLTVTRIADGRTIHQAPVTLSLPACGTACQLVRLPTDTLQVGQYTVLWVPNGKRSPLQAKVCYNPLDIGHLKDLLTPAQVADVLPKLNCPLPKDPADRAIAQVRIDKLAEYVDQQAQDPKTDLRDSIRTCYEQLTRLVNELRSGQPYSSRQRGWFECAICSPVDGSAQPSSLFVPYDYDRHPDRKYALFLNLHAGGGTHGGPGYREGLDRDVTDRLILHPFARGGHAGYEGVPANDILTQLREVMTRYRIDPDAIHVSGASAGGFGSFSLGAIFPDLFATCMPVCGGGSSVPVEQMSNLPTFIHHGLQDLTVPAFASITCALRMQTEHCPLQTYLHDGAGHGVGLAASHITHWENLKQIRRDSCPRSVVLTGGIPQLKHAYWLSILSYQDIHKTPYLRADFAGENHLVLTSRNVAWARIDLPCKWVVPDRPLQIIDQAGLHWTQVAPGEAKAIYVHVTPDNLHAQTEVPADLNDPAIYTGGGAASMFYLGRPVRIVYGTAGLADQTASLEKLANDIRRFNYGAGDSWSGGYAILKDSEVSDDTLKTCDLILLGTPWNNSLLSRMANALPVKFASDKITAQADQPLSWKQDEVLLSLYYRNPLAPDRRIWWFAGVKDRQAFSNLTQMTCLAYFGQLSPELIVQTRDTQRVTATAFVDSRWNLVRPAPLKPAKDTWATAADFAGDINACLTRSLPVDLGVVSRTELPERLDWANLTTGEALLTIQYDPLLTVTATGQELRQGRELSTQRLPRYVKTPAFTWAGLPADSLEPQADYRVLCLARWGIIEQAEKSGARLRDWQLIPADLAETIVQRHLQAKGILSTKRPPATHPAVAKAP